MYGFRGEDWKQSRHMWPVPSNATTVVTDSQFLCKDGRKIRVGDCALFKPLQDSPPFVGIIRRLTFNKEENPSFEVNWLYRPADLKLAKGIFLEAAPNEIFYSFHKDEISAASLLHPCKVAFLRKGVELPSGISAFVCRRAYDIVRNCLRWLTDQDYLNEEINQLLEKTKLEMHGAVQSGGRSSKPLNCPTTTQSLKSSSDSIQSSSFGVQSKGKKRERGDQGSDSSKKERLFKTEEGDSGQFRPESMLKSEIAKITDKGGLVDFDGVEKLVQLMQLESGDKKIDLAGRVMLVNVIAVTDQYDCLSWFVQFKGLPVLDEWLQEVHKGKIGDGNMLKESDKSVEDFLLALLRALDKLPVNLNALQTCNVGKSVNHLRSHKNAEIQRKARSLVDTWKKRVEAEMKMTDSQSVSTHGVSWPAKPASSEGSQVGNRKTGVSSENVAKTSAVQPSVSKIPHSKPNSGELLSKSPSPPGSTKGMSTLAGSNSKEKNMKLMVGAVTSDLPLTPIKEERSSGSSQSQTNSLSCSSEHAKTIVSCREDARSSSAVSMSAGKIHGGVSRNRKSSNGLRGAGHAVPQKEPRSAKNSSRNSPAEKVSPTQTSHEKSPDHPLADQGNSQRLILRLPNSGRSPSRGASGGTFEEPAILCSKASPPAEKNESQDTRVKAKTDCLQTNAASNLINDASDANGALTGFEEGKGSPIGDERCMATEDGNKVAKILKPTSSSSGFVSRSGQIYDASLSPMNALVESCVKFSEASVSTSPGDDGMNLLASVAAGEIFRSKNESPLASPERKSPPADESSSGNDCKSKHYDGGVARTLSKSDGGTTGEHHLETVDPLQFKNDSRHPVTAVSCEGSVVGEAVSSSCVEKTGDDITRKNISDLLQKAEGPCLLPEPKAGVSEVTVPAIKEADVEPGGANHLNDQKDLGIQWAKGSSSSDSKLKSRNSSFDEDKKFDHLDERITEHDKILVSKKVLESVNIEKKEVDEKLPELSSDIGNENQIIAEKVSGTGITVQKPSLVAENCEPIDLKKEDIMLPTAAGNALMVSRDKNADDMKSGEIEPDKKPMDLDSAVSAGINGYVEESLGTKEVLGHCSGISGHAELPIIPGKEIDVPKTSECNLDGIESEAALKRHASSVNPPLTDSGSDTAVKLDFDLNEGFPVDDVSQGEIVRQEEPATLSAVHVPCALPFPMSSMSGSLYASITAASAAKGPVVPPESPMRNKGELGWKGSAATSAFRPAEPRKISEAPSNTSEIPSVDATPIKQIRPLLDFDLNVANELSFDDVASHGSLESGPHDRSSTVGFDLDLNRVDETLESVSFSTSKLDIPNGGSVSRDFDLNNGPGLDEVGTEVSARSQQMKSTTTFPSAVHGSRANNPEFGNYSSWFPPGNSYSAITVPPLLAGRGEQSYVAGAQRIMFPTGSTPFGTEFYREPVLSSSPAVAYPPTTPFPYPGFPFETNFPLSSNSLSGCSTAYMDSSTLGGLCFPTMPLQPVGPGGVVSSTYPRPYVMSLPGGTSNVIPDSRKWGSQSLDLNAGPGSGADTEGRDDRLPSGLRQIPVPNSQALMEEHMKMFQVAGVLKRKEPDGGWDGADRLSYKQPSWQ
ncbi:putative transcription regulator IWS1 family [Lupinus albus]|uniref:Putative transcription regulator IWS1 family n=1 Tax=Lupinus albus TaxID=3870 RepID=A0A6A4R224_LUPAL|nr:putative transcription regulator IWS1 family [Lupinus albus]